MLAQPMFLGPEPAVEARGLDHPQSWKSAVNEMRAMLSYT